MEVRHSCKAQGWVDNGHARTLLIIFNSCQMSVVLQAEMTVVLRCVTFEPSPSREGRGISAVSAVGEIAVSLPARNEATTRVPIEGRTWRASHRLNFQTEQMVALEGTNRK